MKATSQFIAANGILSFSFSFSYIPNFPPLAGAEEGGEPRGDIRVMSRIRPLNDAEDQDPLFPDPV